MIRFFVFWGAVICNKIPIKIVRRTKKRHFMKIFQKNFFKMQFVTDFVTKQPYNKYDNIKSVVGS